MEILLKSRYIFSDFREFKVSFGIDKRIKISFVRLFMFKLEIFEISEMIWVLDPSQDLESIIQMGCLVVNLAVKEPIDRKVLEKDDTYFFKN